MTGIVKWVFCLDNPYDLCGDLPWQHSDSTWWQYPGVRLLQQIPAQSIHHETVHPPEDVIQEAQSTTKQCLHYIPAYKCDDISIYINIYMNFNLCSLVEQQCNNVTVSQVSVCTQQGGVAEDISAVIHISSPHNQQPAYLDKKAAELKSIWF